MLARKIDISRYFDRHCLIDFRVIRGSCMTSMYRKHVSIILDRYRIDIRSTIVQCMMILTLFRVCRAILLLYPKQQRTKEKSRSDERKRR